MIQSRKAEREALAKVESGEDQEQVLKDAVVLSSRHLWGDGSSTSSPWKSAQETLECTDPIYLCGRHKKPVTVSAAPYRGSLRSVGSEALRRTQKSGYLTGMIYLRFHMI